MTAVKPLTYGKDMKRRGREPLSDFNDFVVLPYVEVAEDRKQSMSASKSRARSKTRSPRSSPRQRRVLAPTAGSGTEVPPVSATNNGSEVLTLAD